MQRLEVSGAVRPIYWSLGVKRLIIPLVTFQKRASRHYNDETVNVIFENLRYLL